MTGPGLLSAGQRDPARDPQGAGEDIIISGANGNTVTMDIVDTPGVTTNIYYHEFLEFGMEKEEAIIRAREATEGVAEAMHWLREDINGVIYMLDSTLDPFQQVNIMMIGIIEAMKPAGHHNANKIDLPDASPAGSAARFPNTRSSRSPGLKAGMWKTCTRPCSTTSGDYQCRTSVLNAGGNTRTGDGDPERVCAAAARSSSMSRKTS